LDRYDPVTEEKKHFPNMIIVSITVNIFSIVKKDMHTLFTTNLKKKYRKYYKY